MNSIQNQSQGSLREKFIISYGSEDVRMKQRAIWQVWGSYWLNICISQPVWDTDICQTPITWVSPSCCNMTGATHLLLCSTKPKPIPALNCSQSLAGFSERGWGSRSSEKPVGWKPGEGGQSQARLGAGTCPAAWQTNVVFYWRKGGALQGSLLQTHTFLMCRCPLFCGDSLTALAGDDLCWQFSSLKWSRLC